MEDCYEKAKQLKADMLLNLIEGSQTYGNIRTAANAFDDLAARLGGVDGKDFKQMSKRFMHKGWRSALRKGGGAMSSMYLAWMFGFKPLISDIKACGKSFETLRRDIDRWRTKGIARYSATSTIKMIIDPQQEWSLGSVPGVTYPLRRDRYEVTAAKHPTIRYVLRVRPTETVCRALLGQIDYVLERYASTLATMAWELVPYSFVVYWFVDMRGLLRAIDDALGVTPYEVISFPRSYSYVTQTAVHGSYYSPCTETLLGGPYELAHCNYSHYERRLALVDTHKVVPKLRFGKTQAAELAALIVQYFSTGRRTVRGR